MGSRSQPRKRGGGEIRLVGHRVGLFHLVRRYREGYSPEMLVCQYPTLPLALVHKVIALQFLLDEHLRGPLWLAILRHNTVGGLPVSVFQPQFP